MLRHAAFFYSTFFSWQAGLHSLKSQISGVYASLVLCINELAYSPPVLGIMIPCGLQSRQCFLGEKVGPVKTSKNYSSLGGRADADQGCCRARRMSKPFLWCTHKFIFK